MQKLRSVLFTSFFIVFTGIGLPIMALSSLLPGRALHAVVWFWSWILCQVLKHGIGLDFEVRGREHISSRPAIYAAKHQSAWDTFIYFMIFDTPSYVLKKELYRIPFWKWVSSRYGAIGVDRSGGASALKQLIADTRDRLQRGNEVIIFPEGTRTAPGLKLPYQPGIAAMYGAADVPVVPVAVNSGLFWGRRSVIKRPGKIVIEFLPAIEPGLKRRDFMQRLETEVEAATDRLVAEGISRYPATRAALATAPSPAPE